MRIGGLFGALKKLLHVARKTNTHGFTKEYGYLGGNVTFVADLEPNLGVA